MISCRLESVFNELSDSSPRIQSLSDSLIRGLSWMSCSVDVLDARIQGLERDDGANMCLLIMYFRPRRIQLPASCRTSQVHNRLPDQTIQPQHPSLYPCNSSFLPKILACRLTSSTISDNCVGASSTLPLPASATAALGVLALSVHVYFIFAPSLNPSSNVAGCVEVRGSTVWVILMSLWAFTGRSWRKRRGTPEVREKGLKVVVRVVR